MENNEREDGRVLLALHPSFLSAFIEGIMMNEREGFQYDSEWYADVLLSTGKRHFDLIQAEEG